MYFCIYLGRIFVVFLNIEAKKYDENMSRLLIIGVDSILLVEFSDETQVSAL